MPYFSIIIPVYNGEKSINYCLNSILKQNFTDYEIICIDDGSTDNSLNILYNYCLKDTRIKLIKKENSGVSDSRNIGIKNALGEKILFIDIDDCLVDGALKIIYNNSFSYDFTLFGFKIEGSNLRKNDTEVLKYLKENNKLNSKDIIMHILSQKNNIGGYVWRCTYSRNILEKNSILFEKKLKISEDFLFLIECFSKSKRISIIPEELYIYKINDNSVTSKYIPSMLEDMEYVNAKIKNNILSNDINFEKGYEACVANTYLQFIQNESRFQKNIFKILKKAKTVKKNGYKEVLKKVCKNKSLFNKKPYIGIILFRYNLEWLYILLFKLKNKLRGK